MSRTAIALLLLALVISETVLAGDDDVHGDDHDDGHWRWGPPGKGSDAGHDGPKPRPADDADVYRPAPKGKDGPDHYEHGADKHGRAPDGADWEPKGKGHKPFGKPADKPSDKPDKLTDKPYYSGHHDKQAPRSEDGPDGDYYAKAKGPAAEHAAGHGHARGHHVLRRLRAVY